jgi:hypothetical protein
MVAPACWKNQNSHFYISMMGGTVLPFIAGTSR